MNIKDQEVYELATELAKQSGVTFTDAVKRALQHTLLMEQKPAIERELMIERVRLIGATRCGLFPLSVVGQFETAGRVNFGLTAKLTTTWVFVT